MVEPKQEKAETENQETAIATTGSAEIQTVDNDLNSLLQQLGGEVEDTLKQLSVTEFSGAKGFIDQDLTLLDAFPFVMTEDDRQNVGQKIDVDKVIFVVADSGGVVHNVMQNLNSSRERFITLYSKIRAAGQAAGVKKQLSLTHVAFREVGKPNFGNKPIILMITEDTQQVWS